MGKKINITSILIIGFIIICPFFQGLYFYFQAYIVGAYLLGILIYYIIENKTIKIEISINHLCIFLGIFLYFISIFYAVDKGMAYIGFLKISVIYLFYLVIMQSDIRKKDMLNSIAISGIIMSLINLVIYFMPYYNQMLLQKGRLGSFFQYPNTFALFMLICIIILISKDTIKIYESIGLIIMISSILLTFSRSMYIISIGCILIISIYDRKKIRYILPCTLLGIALWYSIMNSLEISYVFNRIEETSTKTSEWLTRLLYYKDSIAIMKDHPFGTGHLGYYYIQRIYQTGASYYVKYIHSNVLQIVMDIGIIGFVLMGVYFVQNIFNKQLSFYDKILLLIIFGHGAIDFDFQFLVIGLFIIIIVHKDKNKLKIININVICSIIIISIFLVNYVYMAISSYLFNIKEYESSLYMYPYNTEAKLKLAKKCKEKEPKKAYELADNITKNNKYVVDAYVIKRDIDYNNKELEKAYISAIEIINQNPLSIIHLEKYSSILLQLAKMNIMNDSKDKALEQLELIFNIPSRLNELAKQRLTDYNVKHIPRLFMSETLTGIYEEARILYDRIID